MNSASDQIRRWREHPVTMVRELFEVEPDLWQQEALEAFPNCPRLAMKACAGPGKTALLAWLGWNFLLTRPHPYIACTSITGQNLYANLWTELARWYDRSPLLKKAFTKTGNKIYNNDAEATWKLEARTWARDANAEQIGNALAGVHADYVMWLLDESGDYPDAIMPTCEGIFAGSPKEAHIVQAGNPTRRGGPLYSAWRNINKLWHLIEITADPDSPSRTPRVSVEHARAMISQYGRDNPWVKVKIFGEFPDTDFNALISEDEVRAAFARSYREYDIENSPKVLGVDVAQMGDDQSVIFRRQGLQGFKSIKHRNINSIQGAGIVSREWQTHGIDACFVDATGGFGAGWLDQLGVLGFAPTGVHFSSDAIKKERYFNKRAEMYFEAADWIKRGGALHESEELLQGLVNTTYSIRKDRLLLEPKEDVKAKIGYSPDDTDAFILTFAFPVSPKSRGAGRGRHTFEYDPFAGAGLNSAVSDSYDPFR
ncbi:hypothetical protein FHT86_002163 [Rhizobium sp. BK313]|uniref:hypothetical protein n=1 Tax=Rhizobium sp. BK313 TaxID=2587081 RepID=UPI00161AE730|nr:hypothetical protein [Rhizobium sp. BK313]MBB3453907.1 hypothetical protein [Rhizobium sp. BK313]